MKQAQFESIQEPPNHTHIKTRKYTAYSLGLFAGLMGYRCGSWVQRRAPSPWSWHVRLHSFFAPHFGFSCEGGTAFMLYRTCTLVRLVLARRFESPGPRRELGVFASCFAPGPRTWPRFPLEFPGQSKFCPAYCTAYFLPYFTPYYRGLSRGILLHILAYWGGHYMCG